MPEMTIRLTFGELDELGHRLRFEPHTVFHLFLGQGQFQPFWKRRLGKLCELITTPWLYSFASGSRWAAGRRGLMGSGSAPAEAVAHRGAPSSLA